MINAKHVTCTVTITTSFFACSDYSNNCIRAVNLSGIPATPTQSTSYSRSSTQTPAASISRSPTQSPSPSSCSWLYKGCFNDNANGGARVIPNRVGVGPADVASCASAAVTAGYDTFGLQNGSQCWAGLGVPYSALGPASGCPAYGGLFSNQVYLSSCASSSISCTNGTMVSNAACALFW